jgi:DNA-binding NarL/FixJ family response regulator
MWAEPAADYGADMAIESGRVVRVFLLDDHEIVRQGITALLEAQPDIEVVGEASTAVEALARIPAVRPDVAVLDVRLPDGTGCRCAGS